MNFHEIIAQYGYAALFIGTFLEGETILLIAGYLAHEGDLNLGWAILAAFLGTFAGDQTFFFLGRIKGIQFLEKRENWQSKSQKAFDLLHRHQVPVILGFRFLYGIRNVTPFVIGASGLRPLRFFILNMLGAATWAISFGILGYQFGYLAELLLNNAKKYEMVVLGGLCLIALVFFLWSNISSRRARENGAVKVSQKSGKKLFSTKNAKGTKKNKP
ncbi:MAG: DedA family protein [Methylococcaceae bacterium]|nr:MAG: DedA family protein [Methylococcaceae bacterium]